MIVCEGCYSKVKIRNRNKNKLFIIYVYIKAFISSTTGMKNMWTHVLCIMSTSYYVTVIVCLDIFYLFS